MAIQQRIGAVVETLELGMEPPYEHCIHVEGTSGDTLFWRVHERALTNGQGTLEDYQTRLQSAIDRHLSKITADSGDRAMAVCGALVIERSLNDLLSSWIPGFATLDEGQEFSLSSKVDLARACALVPKHILDSIEPIRKIRNKFAHNLELTTFDDTMTNKYWQSLQDHLGKLVNRASDNRRDAFKALVLMVSLALDVYTEHCRRACKYIRNPENEATLLGTR